MAGLQNILIDALQMVSLWSSSQSSLPLRPALGGVAAGQAGAGQAPFLHQHFQSCAMWRPHAGPSMNHQYLSWRLQGARVARQPRHQLHILGLIRPN